MRRILPFVALALVQSPMAMAETRQLDVHEHGTGALNIAIEGTSVVMEFEAPGFDIVGFEYAATSDEDKAKIEAATATLSSPLALFAFPDAAGCTVTASSVSLHEEDHHDDHDHEHDEDAHDHDHAHDDDHDDTHQHDEDHDHDEDHAEKDGHDDHDADHAHEEKHDHEEHGEDAHEHEDASHTAFEAAYELTCSDPSQLTRLDLPYFQTFPNAEKLEVQIVNQTGAAAYEATREAPAVKF